MNGTDKTLAAAKALSGVSKAYRAALAAKRTVTALLVGYTVVRTAVILRILTK
jgi:hypothetical protein